MRWPIVRACGEGTRREIEYSLTQANDRQTLERMSFPARSRMRIAQRQQQNTGINQRQFKAEGQQQHQSAELNRPGKVPQSRRNRRRLPHSTDWSLIAIVERVERGQSPKGANMEQQEDGNEAPCVLRLQDIAAVEQKSPAEDRAELKLVRQAQQLDVVAHVSILSSRQGIATLQCELHASTRVQYGAFAARLFAVK